jgi:hypothetical protein
MKNVFVAVLGLALITTAPAIGSAAEQCPVELGQAQAALKSAQASLKKSSPVAKSQEIQAPRSQAGAKSQDIQAPRGQQEIQAPRGQDIQAPKSQDIQAPRSQDIQAPRVNQAVALVRQAEAACKLGDMALSMKKAKEALALLK